MRRRILGAKYKATNDICDGGKNHGANHKETRKAHSDVDLHKMRKKEKQSCKASVLRMLGSGK